MIYKPTNITGGAPPCRDIMLGNYAGPFALHDLQAHGKLENMVH